MESTVFNPFIGKYAIEIQGNELERFKVEFDKIYPFKECHSKRRQWMRKELYFTSLQYLKNPSLANKIKQDIISKMYARNYYFAKNITEYRAFIKKRLNDFVSEASLLKQEDEKANMFKIQELRNRYRIVIQMSHRAVDMDEWNPDFDEITKQEWEAIKNY